MRLFTILGFNVHRIHQKQINVTRKTALRLRGSHICLSKTNKWMSYLDPKVQMGEVRGTTTLRFAVQQWWRSAQTYGEYEHQLMEQNKAVAKKRAREGERDNSVSPSPYSLLRFSPSLWHKDRSTATDKLISTKDSISKNWTRTDGKQTTG